MSYFLPTDKPEIPNPEAVFVRLCRDLPEFAHIGEAEARIEFLMRTHAEVKGGRAVLGTVFRPDVQGRLREVFQWLLEEKFGGSDEDKAIDFLVVLDAQFWMDASDRDREILVYHELCHIQPAFDKMGIQRFDKETGLPVLTLQNHDVEEFSATVRRYGAYSNEIRDFVKACADGEAEKGLDRA